MIGELLAKLDEIEDEIDKELGSREILDSHDYSSSRYSGYDDGFNSGVQEATDAFRTRVEAFLRAHIAERRGRDTYIATPEQETT